MLEYKDKQAWGEHAPDTELTKLLNGFRKISHTELPVSQKSEVMNLQNAFDLTLWGGGGGRGGLFLLC